MPRQWTTEARQQLGERMKALHAARREKKQLEATDPVAHTAPPNPIATDVIVTPRPKPAPKRPAAEVVTPTSPVFVQSLITDLAAIPHETITFEECGSLLNALSKASTDVALTRRQRQEQLDAGTHRAPCKTCGRMIDISKPGGFQILTERDEHWMPRNSYYCSQNCLLARNMPSHAKSTPRQKLPNQA